VSQHGDQVSSESHQPRKPYDPPTLRDYGTVRDMTATNPAGPNFDGGGGANIYAS
jgi:hypothetical protein